MNHLKKAALTVLALAAVLVPASCERNDLYSILESHMNKSYSLRDTGPAGGLIFHIVDNGNGTKTYYEAAPVDQHTGCAWITGGESDLTTNGNTSTGIGTGWNNTFAIAAQADHTGSAAQICREYTVGGYTDWFLPSSDELYEMC